MKKIAFLNSTLNIGGAEKLGYEIMRDLDKARFTVKSFCLYGPGVIGKRLTSEGIDLTHSLMRNKYDFLVIFRLIKALKAEEIDILYLESSPLVLFWGFICGRIARIPYIYTTIHTMRKPEAWKRYKSGIINRLILRRLDRVGVPSRIKYDSLIKEYGLDSKKLELIQNGIDIKKFDRLKKANGLKKELGISRDQKIIGIVGRLVNEKAHDVFLKAAQHIIGSEPNVKFLIIGDGEEKKNLKALADGLGISKNVIFIDKGKDTENIPGLISIFDVAVLSSRMELFPLVLLEYMAASKPIVATRVGGNPEIIVHGESGIIVPPEDPKALAENVIAILKDKDMGSSMAALARKRVKKEFSLERMVERTERFFLNPAPRYFKTHIILAGPGLSVKGGISSFARNYLSSRSPEGSKITYHATTIDGSKILKTFFFLKSFLLFAAKLVFDRTIKIVHVCSSSKGSFYRKAMILILSRLFKKATIFHIHGGGFHLFHDRGTILRKFFIRKVLDITDSIIVLSESCLLDIKGITKNRNIKVIPNPIDTSDFISIRGSRDNSSLNVFTAGRLYWLKGTYDILDIIPRILKEIPGVKFHLAGDGDVEKVREIVRNKGIEKNVFLPGWLDKHGLIKNLKDAGIFLLPSYTEGLPVAMLEAMASGLPVVSTRVGGIPELVEDGVNGFLVEPGEKQKLGNRIIKLLKDADLRNRMGKNNIDKIDRFFRLDRIVGKFYKEYERLVEVSPRPGRLRWYIKRLSCMSTLEIIHRMGSMVQAEVKRFSRGNVDIDRLLKKKIAPRTFYFKDNAIKEFSRLFPGRSKDILREADEISAHRFKIFDLDWDAGKDIDWHKDILTGKTWPLVYQADIDFKNNHDSKEIRFIWELNRHQHLVTLAKAYFLTKDKRYKEEARGQILSWIEQNPPYKGVNWTSALEVSLRLISWCWAYKFIGIDEDRDEFLRSVYLQTKFIERNLSKYSSANNHLIGEACGLIITALSFPEFKDSDRWLYKGKSILFREILRQVHPDGVTKEQAFHYQGFIMELFVLAAELLIKNNIKIPRKVMDRFFSMSEFVMNIIDSKGKAPLVGDSDDGRAIRLSNSEDFSLFKSILTSACILSQRGDFKSKGGTFSEEHFWIFGLKGYKAYRSIRTKRPALGSRLFKKGGYAVFRNGKDEVLLMDCGKLGYGSIAAHGHADLLSVTLVANGAELLVDPGTYLYHTGGVWRDYFRGTRAHNTVTLDDNNQSEITGPFMWGKRPLPRIEKWKSSKDMDYISAAYKNSRISHRRTIYFDKKKGLWRIEDFLNTARQSTVRQYFHLSPAVKIRLLDPNVIEVENQGIYLYITLDSRLTVDVKKGRLDPILGWSSDIFGTKVESPTLVNTAVIGSSRKFTTFLRVSNRKLSRIEV
ncbi:MAG: glycosyltransferase [Candidatus Gorgyraea atricola]|nr:glycosyltransferase [Candidatus Gorgyraea atricola]